MPYFSYHGRNKKLIKEGSLTNYFYVEKKNKIYLVLQFKDGRQFPIKEERWREYDSLIHQHYKGGISGEKHS